MVDDAALRLISLSRAEYALILTRLGRVPNDVELGMFGALWSEHCGYKHSRPLLRLLPTQGEHVLTKAGQEHKQTPRMAALGDSMPPQVCVTARPRWRAPAHTSRASCEIASTAAHRPTAGLWRLVLGAWRG